MRRLRQFLELQFKAFRSRFGEGCSSHDKFKAITIFETEKLDSMKLSVQMDVTRRIGIQKDGA